MRRDGVLASSFPSMSSACGTHPTEALSLRAEVPSRLELRLLGASTLEVTGPAPCAASTACVGAGEARAFDLAGGQDLALLLTGGAGPSTPYALHWRLRPLRAQGLACDVTREADVCAAGLRCASILGAPATCEAAHAPSVDSVVAERLGRNGQDLRVTVTATDADGDIETLRLGVRDAASQELALVDGDGDGLAESGTFETPATGAWPWVFVSRGFFEAHPEATSVEVEVSDASEAWASPVRVQVSTIAEALPGSACDPAGLVPACPVGYACGGLTPTCTAGQPAQLQGAAWQVGAPGGDRLVAVGSDPDGDATRWKLTFLAADGQPTSFDLDGDGKVESEASAWVTATAGLSSVSGVWPTSTWPSSVASVRVLLEDATGLSSAPQSVSRAAFATRALAQSCDARGLLEPCQAGLACAAGACGVGQAPVFDEVGWVRVGSGARLRLAAHDSDADLDHLLLTLRDASGASLLLLDTDHDGQGDSAILSVALGAPSLPDGSLRAEVDLDAFASLVPRLGVSLRDRSGLATETELSLLSLPERSVGQACSVAGLDRCEAGAVCWEGGSSALCESWSSRRALSCSSAPLLVSGTTSTAMLRPSLWDAPVGCAEGDPSDLPEAWFRFQLGAQASRVVLTTDLPGTEVDTVLYVLPACAESGSGSALGCADDISTEARIFTSRLELSSVPAGTYLVLVESWGGSTAGQVELGMEVTP